MRYNLEATAVLMAKNAILGYNPAITIDQAILLRDSWRIDRQMLEM
jgi:hypothetical protein